MQIYAKKRSCNRVFVSYNDDLCSSGILHPLSSIPYPLSLPPNNNNCHMMFELNEEQLMIQKAARDFARNECLPGVIERDDKQQFPTEQIKKLADLGFLGMMVDPKYGGAGMDTVSYVLAMEE